MTPNWLAEGSFSYKLSHHWRWIVRLILCLPSPHQQSESNGTYLLSFASGCLRLLTPQCSANHYPSEQGVILSANNGLIFSFLEPFFGCLAPGGEECSSFPHVSAALNQICPLLQKTGLGLWYHLHSMWQSFHNSGIRIISDHLRDRLWNDLLVIGKTSELCLSLDFLIPFHLPVPSLCSYWPLLKLLTISLLKPLLLVPASSAGSDSPDTLDYSTRDPASSAGSPAFYWNGLENHQTSPCVCMM